MLQLVDNTPVELHNCGTLPVLVKREDLCCPYPGPSFSKMRGVVAHLQGRSEQHIGVLDTFHSKAGWAVAWACKQLGKQCVDFWPVYKADRDRLKSGVCEWPPRDQQRQARGLGASLAELPAGRSAVLYHQAKKELLSRFPGGYVMPNALKLPESITENAAEARRTVEAGAIPGNGHLIISISSGTVAAGVLKGLAARLDLDHWHVVLHMGYSRSEDAARAYMEKVGGLKLSYNVEFVDEGYGYKDHAKGIEAPFPCNEHYDLKAWKWLKANQEQFTGEPVVFWNIGD